MFEQNEKWVTAKWNWRRIAILFCIRDFFFYCVWGYDNCINKKEKNKMHKPFHFCCVYSESFRPRILAPSPPIPIRSWLAPWSYCEPFFALVRDICECEKDLFNFNAKQMLQKPIVFAVKRNAIAFGVVWIVRCQTEARHNVNRMFYYYFYKFYYLHVEIDNSIETMWCGI